ncbi:hypothetical protein ACCY16_02215 [Candidatus Pantoea formicae]|uniref:hypothetical protein n=1 Tax=Candidatus Pantoea formicae TaxID=2608355 RepID=UPI003ED9DE2A
MANLEEQSAWEAGIYQLEQTDRAKAGAGGVLNTQGGQLANRTRWLRDQLEGKLIADNNLSDIKDVTEALKNLGLTSDDAFRIIGGFFKGEGLESVGSGAGSVFDRVSQRGQFDVSGGVLDPKGIAGFTFGGEKNRGAMLIDERGRVQFYAVKNGVMTAARVAVPFTEPYGQGVAAWNGVVLRLPFAGAEDDTLHPGLILLPQSDGSAHLYVAGPGQYTNEAPPYADSKVVAPRVVTTRDIAPALLECSVNPTTWLGVTSWVELFTVNTGVSNSGPNFTGLYIAGGTLAEAIYTYHIECNDVFVSSLNAATAKHVLRVTNLRDPSDYRNTATNLTQFGYVYDATAKTLKVYAKIGGRNEGATLIPLRYSAVGSSGTDKVIINRPDDEYLTTEPSGIVYVDIANSLTSNTYVPLNNGEVVKTTGAVVRLTNGISAATKSPVRDAFMRNDDYCAINRGYAGLGGVTASRTGTGTYTIAGASTGGNSVAWKIKSPSQNGNGGIQSLVASITGDTGSLLTIEVRTLTYVYSSATGLVTPTLGALTDIPVNSWVDIHTTLI